jgi:hypothetical protein
MEVVTSTCVTGPTSFKRLALSTGMTSNVSVLSAPSLCLRGEVKLSAGHDSHETQAYVQHSINKDVDAMLLCDRNRFQQLVLGTPPRASGPFLMKFP